MHFLYILHNKNKNKYYVGVTNNLGRRLNEHNDGKNFSTRGRGPWKIVYTERYNSPKEAKQREYQIKKKKRKSYIEWLIKNNGPVV